jgi:hypothetical protein
VIGIGGESSGIEWIPQVPQPLCNDGAMDINKILSDLRAEKEQIEQAILVLQGLGQGQKRRGRKPAWMKQVADGPAKPKKRRGRPPGSQNRPEPDDTQ